MQKNMRFCKLHHFNIYRLLIKLLALLLSCFLFVSCNTKETQQLLTTENKIKVAETAVNINTASVRELEKLPNIGTKLAQDIVEYREKYGNFRRPEHLILVPGISDKKFRQVQDLIKIE
jgi:competence ComEA-like helix-hairpin-helix protein